MSKKQWPDPRLAQRLEATPVVAVSLLLTALLSVLFSVWGALVTEDSLGIFRSQLAFTGDRFAEVVGTWDVAEFIRLTASLDFIYPVAYATAIAAVWALASRSESDRSSWPVVAAMIAVSADWLENALHLIAIRPMITAEGVVGVAVAIGSVFAVIKWGAIVAALSAAARAAWRHSSWGWRVVAVVLAASAGGLAGLVASLTTGS
jgi:hypothetical protein